jgi:hypothetical protein
LRKRDPVTFMTRQTTCCSAAGFAFATAGAAAGAGVIAAGVAEAAGALTAGVAAASVGCTACCCAIAVDDNAIHSSEQDQILLLDFMASL